MTTSPPDIAVSLAKLDIKLDQLLASSGDHEARLRKLEELSTSSKSWQGLLANSIMTAINAALAGTIVLGG